MTPDEIKADRKECAYIRLSGAAERLKLLLEHRSERNYAIGVAAVVSAHAEYLASTEDEVAA